MTPFLRYFLIINVITFLVRGIDKIKAMRQKRRISEKQLLYLVLAGGVIGALAGMQFFRHKTIKGPFLLKFYAVTLAWIIGVALYLYHTGLL